MSFRDLDRYVRTIISSLVDGEKDLNKQPVGQRFKAQTETFLNRERCKTFLESLYFLEGLSRQEYTADAHK